MNELNTIVAFVDFLSSWSPASDEILFHVVFVKMHLVAFLVVQPNEINLSALRSRTYQRTSHHKMYISRR